MSDRVIDTQGAAVHVAENGAGEPALMFLHYWVGSSRTWRGMIDRRRCYDCWSLAIAAIFGPKALLEREQGAT